MLLLLALNELCDEMMRKQFYSLFFVANKILYNLLIATTSFQFEAFFFELLACESNGQYIALHTYQMKY